MKDNYKEKNLMQWKAFLSPHKTKLQSSVIYYLSQWLQTAAMLDIIRTSSSGYYN